MEKHLMPWWFGYLLINPLRKWTHDPVKMLGTYVKEGMKVMDIGPAMGFFSLPLSKMVGEKGTVYCIDLQPQMLKTLAKRIKRAQWQNLELRSCTSTSFLIDDIVGKIDFALAFYVLHEVPDEKRAFTEIYRSLKPGGILYYAEPKNHMEEKSYQAYLATAESCGFRIEKTLSLSKAYGVVFRKHA